MVFDNSQVDQFLSRGYVVLRDAFPRAVAEAGCRFVWDRILQSWDNCFTFGQPMIHLRQNFKTPPFDGVMNPRLAGAIDALAGEGRWIFDTGYGWWPVLLPGFPGPGGWHLDITTRQYLRQPEKGVVTLFLFSDVGPGDGGTPVVPGSHLEIARFLAAAGDGGLDNADVLAQFGEPRHVENLEGAAGDVAFLHPFLLHGLGPNTGSKIRFACNPMVRLRAPLQFEGGTRSAVEQAIASALRTE